MDILGCSQRQVNERNSGVGAWNTAYQSPMRPALSQMKSWGEAFPQGLPAKKRRTQNHVLELLYIGVLRRSG